MKFKLFFVLTFFSFSSWAEINLLDMVRADQVAFNMSQECRAHLKQMDRKDFFLPQLQEAIIPIESLGLGGNYFFHYSNDGKEKLRDAAFRDDFTPIIKYSLSHEKALRNMAGAGLYIAHEPLSSRGYGIKQFALRLNPQGRALRDQDFIFSKSIQEKLNPNKVCDRKLIKSLVLNENRVELFYFDFGSGWAVLLSEEVIEHVHHDPTVNYEYHQDVLKIMEAQGLGYMLLDDYHTCEEKGLMHFIQAIPRPWRDGAQESIESFLKKCSPQVQKKILKN